MRARPVLAAALSLAALLTTTGHAAPVKPQIVDPRGDSIAGQPSLDILNVKYSTTGIGRGRTYVPKKLIIALTLAGAPDTSGAVGYTVVSDTDTCGRISIRYAPGTPVGGLIGDTYATFGSCAESLFFPAKVKGSVVTFEFSLKMIKLDRGTEFFDFLATVDACEPVLSEVCTDMASQAAGALDKGTGTGTWVLP